MTLSKHELLPGKTHPIGVTVEDDGVNFCLYCDERVTAVELLLFAQYDAKFKNYSYDLLFKTHNSD